MIDKKLVNAILLYIQENRITQKDFAKLIGATPQTVSNWLTGNQTKAIQSGMAEKIMDIISRDTESISNTAGIVNNFSSLTNVTQTLDSIHRQKLIAEVLKLDICAECKTKVIGVINAN